MRGARYRVSKHMVADPKRRIGRLVLTIAVPPTVPEAKRASLEASVMACPVKQTLREDCAVEVTFDYA